MVSRGRLSCTVRPFECVPVAPTLPRWDSSDMAIAAVSDDRTGRSLLELDGTHLSIQDAIDVARRRRTVRLSDHAADAVRASCALKQELIDSEIPMYGVT